MSICDPRFGEQLGDASVQLKANLKVATNYIHELKKYEAEAFVLAFTQEYNKDTETKAWSELRNASPQMPLGDYAEVASKLATLISGVSGVLHDMTTKGKIKWKWSPWSYNFWRIDICRHVEENTPGGKGIKSSWNIRIHEGDGNEHYGKLSEDLLAGFSLWMYSLECGAKALGKIYDDNEVFKKFGDHKWSRGMSDSHIPFDRLSPSYRIVGNSTSTTIGELQYYMGQTIVWDVPPYDGKFPEEFKLPRILERKFQGTFPLHWPVLGVYNSASFR
jgi:hypothetical protein